MSPAMQEDSLPSEPYGKPKYDHAKVQRQAGERDDRGRDGWMASPTQWT